ncbi:hypothetical protein DEO72_LG8g2647 [Vigna unguiculata]|uniref:Uncharacterized protein n=1 Tax=Vigna unguiculata TaxID=3917 RepID=A0A4D6MSW1_VIGUN|nr:hypothetical protein DEO72_LG8g2647 [Vigna unguiculata]
MKPYVGTIVHAIENSILKGSTSSSSSLLQTRRSFSINDLEELVYIVENLGTRRYDIINCLHVGYIEKLDKWETLVDTTIIPHQQRKGKSVPQMLLDRVLVVDVYWS